MDKKDKRYVVQVEMYVYAENDYMVRKRSHDIKSILGECGVTDPNIKEIGEQPFATMDYRKLDDPTFTPRDKSNDPLPF